METKRSLLLERIALFLEENEKVVKPVTYGVATAGLLYAMRRTRPFLKLKKPSDVPARFLREKLPQTGTVAFVEPSHGTVLMVNHNPLIPLPRFTSPKYLPIKISKVNITSNGISWLEAVVSGRQITFVPVAVQKDYVDCIVTLQRKNKEQLEVGKELVKLGFARVEELPKKERSKDKQLSKYWEDLSRAEKWAEHKRNGYWHFAKQPTIWWKLNNIIEATFSKIMSNILSYKQGKLAKA